jgi:Tol biopolymer transport system component/energy-coupling factor transporter ATP-binding protein EcfA2
MPVESVAAAPAESPRIPGVTDPFPGLRPFDSDEEPIFRGRQRHTGELLRRLAKHRFLAVVGTSGSGKSSLVRAGLLPALDRGFLAGASSRWRIAVMRPGMAPIDNLAEALREKDALGAADPAKLRSSSAGLVETVRDALLAPGESLLVVADQFEELFRYARRMAETGADSEAALFVNLLLTAARRPDSPVYVVLTMRSDFLGDCAQFPGLPEALSESQYLIPRLTREQRQQAIEEPLRLFGATITPQLVEQLLNDSGEEIVESFAGSQYRGGASDPLPVLQHALMRTYLEWKSRPREKGEPIDLPDYRKAGRMASALDQHAEAVFENQLDDAGRLWTERILRCLTTTELGRPIRRPTPLADLYKVVGAQDEKDRAKVDSVLDIFRKPENSFVRLNKDSSVDISHESLIWKWKRLSGWVEKEAASAELYRDLVKDAGGKATWGEPKLSTTLAIRSRDNWNEHWARQYSEASFADVESFLERSRKAVRRQRWIFGFAVGGPVTALIAVLAGILIVRQVEANDRQAAAARLRANLDDQSKLQARLSALSTSQVEERQRLEAQLKSAQEEGQKLAAQPQQSADLQAITKGYQIQLEAAQQARDEEAKKLKEAEDKAAQLEARLNLPPKEPDRPAAAASTPALTVAPPPAVSTTTPPATSTPPASKPTVAAKPSPRILLARGVVNSVAWSPDGKTLASAGVVDPIRLWNVATGATIRVLQGPGVFAVAWSPDGKTLASASDGRAVRLWDAETGAAIRILQGHRDAVRSVAWSPDGRTLASGSGDDTVRLWDAATGELIRTLQAQGNEDVAWSPDGKTIASGGSIDSTIRLWDAASGDLTRTLRPPGLVTCLAWRPDGMALADGGSAGILLWEVGSGRQIGTLGAGNGVVSVSWSPDGKMLAAGDAGKTVQLWDTQTGKILQILQGPQDNVDSVAWSPDGKTLASGSRDKTILLWDVSALITK